MACELISWVLDIKKVRVELFSVKFLMTRLAIEKAVKRYLREFLMRLKII